LRAVGETAVPRGEKMRGGGRLMAIRGSGRGLVDTKKMS